MWPSVLFLVIAIIAVGLLALIAMVLIGKRKYDFNVQEYQTRWLKIENRLIKGQHQGYPLAVLNADKLLDHALIEMGTPGKTMGERMKRVDSKFSNPNAVWFAHRLRNQIAHEPDFELHFNEASRALAAFKQALKDLGAI